MKSRCFIILKFVLFSYIVSSPLLAQTNDPDKFIVPDIPDNTVFSVYEDDAHNIWVGTNGGLGRYDGIEWKKFTQQDYPLVNNKVNSILQDNNGCLWFGTDEGISVYHDGGWMTYTYENMFAHPRFEHITCLFLDTKNNLWIGSKEGGVVKHSSIEQWDSYNPGNSGLSAEHITAINEDNQGNIWFGTYNSGMFIFDGNSNWIHYPEIETIGHEIRVIYKDDYDSLWVGTKAGVIRTYDGLHWNSTGFENVSLIRSIAEDRDKNLWFGTENGHLYKYNRISCTRSNFQFDHTLFSIIRDHSGYLWLGTNGGGVSRLHLNWQTFLKDYFINDINQDMSGNLWVASARSGIFKFNGVKFDTINVDVNLPGANFVNSIVVDKNNWIWCATIEGIHCFDGDEWNSYSKPDLAHETANIIFQDNSGNLWVGTQGGISFFDYNDWTTFDSRHGLPALNILSIWEDHAGHFWFGTAGGGVFEFVNDSVVTIYDMTNKLSNNNVNAIIQDKNYCYWFGTENGIHKLDSTKTDWDHFTQDNSGLTHNTVKCFLKDSADNIWVGTIGGGICKYDGQFWWNDFNRDLKRNEVNIIIQAANNNFWFGSPTGLIKYTPDRDLPQTIITIAPADTIGVASTLFAFSGDDTETPKEKLVYSWCLHASPITYAHIWSEFIDNNFCQVGPLYNGTYTFFVKAKDADGNEDNSPRSHSFTVDITPPTTIINQPSNNEYLCGKVSIIGTAFDNSPINDFQKYQLDFAEFDSTQTNQQFNWKKIYSDITPAYTNTILADWDTDTLCGSYYLKLSAADKLGHSSEYTVLVNIVESLEEASARSGASIESSKNRIQLYIPPGTLENNAQIYFKPVDTSNILFSPNVPVVKSSMAYQIGPKNLLLNKPATLTFNYNDSEISNLDEKKLSLVHYVSLDKYELLGGYVNSKDKTIRTTINKLGTYILVEDNNDREGRHVISDVRCQPRIFSPGGTGFAEKTIISFKLEVDSKISIKIYNLAGRLVRVIMENELLKANYNPIEWDGKDYNGKICPSDLYIVTIKSEREVKTKTVMILDQS